MRGLIAVPGVDFDILKSRQLRSRRAAKRRTLSVVFFFALHGADVRRALQGPGLSSNTRSAVGSFTHMWPGLTRTRITSRAARAAPEPTQVPDISVYTHAAILAADAAVEHSPAQGNPHDQCGRRPAERPWPDGAAGLIRRRRHEECSIAHCRTRRGRLWGWRRHRCSYPRRREIRFEPAHVLLELFHFRSAFGQALLQRQLRRQVCGLDPAFRAVRNTHVSLPAALGF